MMQRSLSLWPLESLLQVAVHRPELWSVGLGTRAATRQFLWKLEQPDAARHRINPKNTEMVVLRFIDSNIEKYHANRSGNILADLALAVSVPIPLLDKFLNLSICVFVL